MKHIRTFETMENMPHLQKYLAYQMGLNRESRSFVILEVIEQFSHYYIVKRLYIANEYSIKKSESEQMRFNYEETKDRIKYQSDDLRDVIDNIPALFDINKYNL